MAARNPRIIQAPVFLATTSAATSNGCLVRGFLLVRMIRAVAKPAELNSSRKAPLSLAPAIQENQSSTRRSRFFLSGPVRTSSAA
jgi:hypothetical protein